MRLELPSTKYEDTYRAAAAEFWTESQNRYKDIYGPEAIKDFGAFVQSRLDMSQGINLPEGYVPSTDYWLINEGEYVGRLSIRHQLTPQLAETGGHVGYDIRPGRRKKGYGRQILKLGLEKARELGLRSVLLTCDETNEGSRKIIEANGGVLDDKRPNSEGGPDKLRYWIAL